MKKQLPIATHRCAECRHITVITNDFLALTGNPILGKCSVLGYAVLVNANACNKLKINEYGKK
jgi:hypothetical protein